MEKKLDAKTAAKIDRALDAKVRRMRIFWPIWTILVFSFLFVFNHKEYVYMKEHKAEWDSEPERYAANVEIIKANKEEIYQISK